MENCEPYTVRCLGGLDLYVGTYTNTATDTLIFVPVYLDFAEILMCEKNGPSVVIGTHRWPVRIYNVSYSVDRLKLAERFRKNPKALALYPFERYISNEVLNRSNNARTTLNLKMGVPLELSLGSLGLLQDKALVLETGSPGELQAVKSIDTLLTEIDKNWIASNLNP